MKYGRHPTVQDFQCLVVLELLRLLSRIMTGTHSQGKAADGDVVSSLWLLCALRRSTLDHEISRESLMVTWLHCRSFGS